MSNHLQSNAEELARHNCDICSSRGHCNAEFGIRYLQRNGVVEGFNKLVSDEQFVHQVKLAILQLSACDSAIDMAEVFMSLCFVSSIYFSNPSEFHAICNLAMPTPATEQLHQQKIYNEASQQANEVIQALRKLAGHGNISPVDFSSN
jgi:hypothetical protein